MPYFKHPVTNFIIEAEKAPLVSSGTTFHAGGVQIDPAFKAQLVEQGFEITVQHATLTPWPTATLAEYNLQRLAVLADATIPD